jgi:hypothetical protein
MSQDPSGPNNLDAYYTNQLFFNKKHMKRKKDENELEPPPTKYFRYNDENITDNLHDRKSGELTEQEEKELAEYYASLQRRGNDEEDEEDDEDDNEEEEDDDDNIDYSNLQEEFQDEKTPPIINPPNHAAQGNLNENVEDDDVLFAASNDFEQSIGPEVNYNLNPPANFRQLTNHNLDSIDEEQEQFNQEQIDADLGLFTPPPQTQPLMTVQENKNETDDDDDVLQGIPTHQGIAPIPHYPSNANKNEGPKQWQQKANEQAIASPQPDVTSQQINQTLVPEVPIPQTGNVVTVENTGVQDAKTEETVTPIELEPTQINPEAPQNQQTQPTQQTPKYTNPVNNGLGIPSSPNFPTQNGPAPLLFNSTPTYPNNQNQPNEMSVSPPPATTTPINIVINNIPTPTPSPLPPQSPKPQNNNVNLYDPKSYNQQVQGAFILSTLQQDDVYNSSYINQQPLEPRESLEPELQVLAQQQKQKEKYKQLAIQHTQQQNEQNEQKLQPIPEDAPDYHAQLSEPIFNQLKKFIQQATPYKHLVNPLNVPTVKQLKLKYAEFEQKIREEKNGNNDPTMLADLRNKEQRFNAQMTNNLNHTWPYIQAMQEFVKANPKVVQWITDNSKYYNMPSISFTAVADADKIKKHVWKAISDAYETAVKLFDIDFPQALQGVAKDLDNDIQMRKQEFDQQPLPPSDDERDDKAVTPPLDDEEKDEKDQKMEVDDDTPEEKTQPNPSTISRVMHQNTYIQTEIDKLIKNLSNNHSSGFNFGKLTAFQDAQGVMERYTEDMLKAKNQDQVAELAKKRAILLEWFQNTDRQLHKWEHMYQRLERAYGTVFTKKFPMHSIPFNIPWDIINNTNLWKKSNTIANKINYETDKEIMQFEWDFHKTIPPDTAVKNNQGNTLQLPRVDKLDSDHKNYLEELEKIVGPVSVEEATQNNVKVMRDTAQRNQKEFEKFLEDNDKIAAKIGVRTDEFKRDAKPTLKDDKLYQAKIAEINSKMFNYLKQKFDEVSTRIKRKNLNIPIGDQKQFEPEPEWIKRTYNPEHPRVSKFDMYTALLDLEKRQEKQEKYIEEHENNKKTYSTNVELYKQKNGADHPEHNTQQLWKYQADQLKAKNTHIEQEMRDLDQKKEYVNNYPTTLKTQYQNLVKRYFDVTAHNDAAVQALGPLDATSQKLEARINSKSSLQEKFREAKDIEGEMEALEADITGQENIKKEWTTTGKDAQYKLERQEIKKIDPRVKVLDPNLKSMDDLDRQLNEIKNLRSTVTAQRDQLYKELLDKDKELTTKKIDHQPPNKSYTLEQLEKVQEEYNDAEANFLGNQEVTKEQNLKRILKRQITDLTKGGMPTPYDEKDIDEMTLEELKEPRDDLKTRTKTYYDEYYKLQTNALGELAKLNSYISDPLLAASLKPSAKDKLPDQNQILNERSVKSLLFYESKLKHWTEMLERAKASQETREGYHHRQALEKMRVDSNYSIQKNQTELTAEMHKDRISQEEKDRAFKAEQNKLERESKEKIQGDLLELKRELEELGRISNETLKGNELQTKKDLVKVQTDAQISINNTTEETKKIIERRARLLKAELSRREQEEKRKDREHEQKQQERQQAHMKEIKEMDVTGKKDVAKLYLDHHQMEKEDKDKREARERLAKITAMQKEADEYRQVLIQKGLNMDGLDFVITEPEDRYKLTKIRGRVEENRYVENERLKLSNLIRNLESEGADVSSLPTSFEIDGLDAPEVHKAITEAKDIQHKQHLTLKENKKLKEVQFDIQDLENEYERVTGKRFSSKHSFPTDLTGAQQIKRVLQREIKDKSLDRDQMVEERDELLQQIKHLRSMMDPELRKSLPPVTGLLSSERLRATKVTMEALTQQKEKLNKLLETEQEMLDNHKIHKHMVSSYDSSMKGLRDLVGDSSMYYSILKNRAIGSNDENVGNSALMLKEYAKKIFEDGATYLSHMRKVKDTTKMDSIYYGAFEILNEKPGSNHHGDKWDEIDEKLDVENALRSRAKTEAIAGNPIVAETYLLSLASDMNENKVDWKQESVPKLYAALRSMNVSINEAKVKSAVSNEDKIKAMLEMVPQKLLGNAKAEKAASESEKALASWRRQHMEHTGNYSLHDPKWLSANNPYSRPYEPGRDVHRLDMHTGNFYPADSKKLKKGETYLMNKPSEMRVAPKYKKQAILKNANSQIGHRAVAYGRDKHRRRALGKSYEPFMPNLNILKGMQARGKVKEYMSHKYHQIIPSRTRKEKRKVTNGQVAAARYRRARRKKNKRNIVEDYIDEEELEKEMEKKKKKKSKKKRR